MDPVSAITAAFGFAKAAGEVSTKLNEIYKDLKDRDVKQQVAELLDKMQELKRSAYALEDENRELRDKLRFKSSAYMFKTPFWYENGRLQQPLCPKCFAKSIAAPVGEPGQDCTPAYRRCLVCGEVFQVKPDDGEVTYAKDFESY